MKYFRDFKKLCTPASLYLFVNVIIFVSIAIQNFGNKTQYCVGQYRCNVPNTFSMFLFKAVYILFWTFILNAICKAGYKEVSWFMVLLPIILLFIILGAVILNSGSARLFEGFEKGDKEQKEKKIKFPVAVNSESKVLDQESSDTAASEEETVNVTFGGASEIELDQDKMMQDQHYAQGKEIISTIGANRKFS